MRYYKLVIVDESHNLRNSEGTRYRNIRELIEYQGCHTLLLTATPYNKDYSDLASQLRLFIGADEDLGIQPEAYIRDLGGVREFAKRHSEIHLRSIRAFEHSTFADDWRDLMKLYLVRRTRTFIKEHYAKTDPSNQRKYIEFPDGSRSYFPDRIPQTLTFETGGSGNFKRLYSEEMVDMMASLKLPRYGLKRYIDQELGKSAPKGDQTLLENLSRAGLRLMGFCRCGFYKRMDSSGIAFMISLYRHALRNAIFIHALANYLPLPIGDEGGLGDGYQDDEDDQTGENIMTFPLDVDSYLAAGKHQYEALQLADSASVRWIDSRYFKTSLVKALQEDNNILMAMLQHAGAWQPSHDEKLAALEQLIRERHPDDKILVFSQFADTVHYLASELQVRGINKIAAVSGNSDNITSIVNRFSPVSNKYPLPLPSEKELRVLIATDVLSEGQNLQDAHIVVNYDMPWAIIRLIQRAGRVDRIGQTAEEVFCYSFFPQEGVEEVIKLRAKLEYRIAQNAETVGSDELFFEGNAQNLTDIYNEESNVLDDEDTEVDLTSQAYEIWQNAIAADPQLSTRIPALADIVYATKQLYTDAQPEGVITYARTATDNDTLSWLNAKSEVVSQSPAVILKALECHPDTPKLAPLGNHHDLVVAALRNISSEKLSLQGVLGSRFSTKYRLYTLLDGYLQEYRDTLFDTTELKRAADDIYNLPMQENAKFLLGQMIKRGQPPQIIAETVTELRQRGELCIQPDDATTTREPRIICSMGLRHDSKSEGDLLTN